MDSKSALIAASILLSCCAALHADEVVLANGDKLNGKVGTIAGGKMKFASPVLGDIVIDMAQVKSFTTDQPATIQIKRDGVVEGKIISGDASKIEVEGKGEIAQDTIKQINPPEQKWTGSVLANGDLSRGNTNAMNLGVAATAVLRREDQINDDRFSLAAAYNFGDTGLGDNTVTSAENWNALIKYDKFFNPKLYGYVLSTAEQDHLADLTYRIAPGLGVGYQWIESPQVNFNTEAGVSYVFENHDPGDTNNYISLRLAYHFDKKLRDNVTFFNNVQYLPAFKDFADYNLYADAGVRTNLTKALFAEFKVQYQRDSTPAPDKKPDDLKFILGAGFTF
jgi:hypothetical protein